MKKRFIFVGCAICLIVVCIVVLIKIDANKQTPLERHIEQINQESTSENNTLATSSTGEVVQVSESEADNDLNIIYNNRHTLECRVISYEVYDDSNILEQTQYPEEYYLEGEYPNPSYIYSGINWYQLREDYPEVAEYLDLDYEEYINSDFDFDGFMAEHSDEYTISNHPDTRYVFVTVEITNISENSVYESIAGRLSFEGFEKIYDTELDYASREAISYVDYLPDLENDDFGHYRDWYNFEPGETHTFTIGYTIRLWPYQNMPFRFTDNMIYYYCIPFPDEQVTSPAYYINSVCLNDLL